MMLRGRSFSQKANCAQCRLVPALYCNGSNTKRPQGSCANTVRRTLIATVRGMTKGGRESRRAKLKPAYTVQTSPTQQCPVRNLLSCRKKSSMANVTDRVGGAISQARLTVAAGICCASFSCRSSNHASLWLLTISEYRALFFFWI